MVYSKFCKTLCRLYIFWVKNRIKKNIKINFSKYYWAEHSCISWRALSTYVGLITAGFSDKSGPMQHPEAKTLTVSTPTRSPTPKMAPAPESTAAAAGRKRKKPQGPSKTLAKKRSDPKSTSVKKNKKEKHKHTTRKEKKPGPTGPHAKKPAEPDQAAAAGDVAAGEGVLLSAAMPPARQLEFFLRSFERAVKMRLSPLELDSYSGLFILLVNSIWSCTISYVDLRDKT